MTNEHKRENVSVIYCRKCNSELVDVEGWDGETAELRCYNCHNGGSLTGFTLGRFMPCGRAELVTAGRAVHDRAEEDRARSRKQILKENTT